MASNLVRITNNCVIQFNSIYKKSIFKTDLYCLKFDNKFQLLSPDGTYNSVDNSYCPYNDNILLKKTPYPWFTDAFLENNKLSSIVSADCPDIEYQNVSVNFVAGFNYGDDDYLSMSRFYYIIDDKYELTVSAIVDYKSNTRFKPNTINIVLDGAIFNTSLNTDIINIQQLFQSNDPEIIKIKEHIFGQNTKTCSELFVEHTIIKKSQILDFEQNGKTYQKFFIEDLSKSYYNRSLDLGEELYINIEPRENIFDKYVAIRLNHTKYNIESYLSKYLYETDTWDIQYEITQSAFDVNDTLISSISQSCGNFNTPYSEILFKPLISDDWFDEDGILKVAYCVLDIRCIAKTTASNLEINRWGRLIINDFMSYFIKSTVNYLERGKIYSKKEIVNHEVSVKSDLPNIIQIVKPYFIFTQTGSTIQLIPYENNIGIELKLNDSIVHTNVKIRFDAREYKCTKFEEGKLIFKIPGTEYLNSTKTYYLIYDDNILSYGNIERIK